MLDNLRVKFAADAALETQIGECLYRVAAPKNAGKGVQKKYVTYRAMNDPRRLKVGGVRSTARSVVEFRCHALTLASVGDVYDALIGVLGSSGNTQHSGTWGSGPGTVIQSAFWDGDTYEETFDAEHGEYVIVIHLIVTWTRA